MHHKSKLKDRNKYRKTAFLGRRRRSKRERWRRRGKASARVGAWEERVVFPCEELERHGRWRELIFSPAMAVHWRACRQPLKHVSKASSASSKSFSHEKWIRSRRVLFLASVLSRNEPPCRIRVLEILCCMNPNEK